MDPQCFWVGWIRIRIRIQVGKMTLEKDKSEEMFRTYGIVLKYLYWIRIRIDLKCWIRIRSDADPQL